MRLLAIPILAMSLLIATVGCKKDAGNEPDVVTVTPEIVSLSTDKEEIKFGGEDPAIITCEATGGNLSYQWEVDLGDIFVLNEDGSQVRFTGSECCIGEKIVKCTVSNDKGSVSKIIGINIYIP